jgi:hypothetical protein
MTLAGLAPTFRGKVMLPVLGTVRAAGSVDLVTVILVTGQARATSPTGPRIWRTHSESSCAGSALGLRGW